MSHVTSPNFAITSQDTRGAIWRLSRTMKAAGWITLSSSNGVTKDTTGAYANDQWNGVIGTGGTGAVASITTVVEGVATLTGLTGFTTGTAGQRWITISGAASGGNNGTFKILSFISATSVTIRNSAAVASDANNGAISWTERIPLSDTYASTTIAVGSNGQSLPQATINVVSTTGFPTSGTVIIATAAGNQTVTYSGTSATTFTGASGGTGAMATGGSVGTIGNSSWINMQGPSTLKIPISTIAQDGYQVNILGSNQTGTTASITAIKGSLVTISGLTNMTFGSSGNVLVISNAANGVNNGSFTITKFLDPNTVLIANPSGIALDANNGSIHWQERLGVTGIRGENITQTTTGAQGEVVGINFDFLTGAGYLVVFPRNNGSGGGPFGWDGTNTITGATSGAVWTPITTPIEFVREIVMWTQTTAPTAATNTMTGYMQCINNSTENASRFSILATSGGSTALIAPGGGGTGNGFPIPGSYAWVGTGGAKTDGRFALKTWTASPVLTHSMCADATFDVGRSADGSFTCAVRVGTGYLGFTYTRLDDQDDGDLDPYIFYTPSNEALTTVSSRTSYTTAYGSSTNGISFNASDVATDISSACNRATFRGWTGRGNINDSFQSFQLGLLVNGGNTYNYTSSTNGTACLFQNITATNNEVVATATVNLGVTTCNSTATLPQATITVVSTTSFPASGSLIIMTATGAQAVTYSGTTATTFTGCTGGTGAMAVGNSVSSPNNVYVGEPIWVVSAQFYPKVMKGTCRWLRALCAGTAALGGGTIADTLGGGASTGFWLQLCTSTATILPFAGGPWDGTTTPTG